MALLTIVCALAHALHDRHDLRLAAHHPAVAPAAHGADLRRARPRQRRRAAQPAARAVRRRAQGGNLGRRHRHRRRRRAQVALLAPDRRRGARRTRPRPPPASATSARCARSSRRTRSPTSSCARWATASPASTRSGCAGWRCCSPSPCPSPCLLLSHAAAASASSARCSPPCRWRLGLHDRALAVLRRSRARRHALLRRRGGLSFVGVPACSTRSKAGFSPRVTSRSRAAWCCRSSRSPTRPTAHSHPTAATPCLPCTAIPRAITPPAATRRAARPRACATMPPAGGTS